MKEPKTCYDELLKYYQTWLTDFTRLTVRLGLCHQNIYFSHCLMVDYLKFPGQGEQPAVVPQCLNRIIKGETAPVALSLVEGAAISLDAHEHLLVHHPMLEGILLSECMRLQQRALANRLASLFHQFSATENRLKLVWLCWYDLMTGADLADWVDHLKFKKDATLAEWISVRQEENGSLTTLMDEYVIFSCRTVLPS